VFPLRKAGVKVCEIESTRHERNDKSELTNTILDPIETRIDGCVGGKSHGTLIVTCDGSGWLWISEIAQC
jgi:hypothetical protein